MPFLKNSFFVLCLLVASPSFAQQPPAASESLPATQPALIQLPQGTRLTTPQGTFQGYSLEEFKIILRLEAEYIANTRKLEVNQVLVQNLTLLTQNQTKQLELLKKDNTTLKAEEERKHKMWVEENRLRHLAENRPNFGSWIAWGTAGVFAVATAVLTSVLISK